MTGGVVAVSDPVTLAGSAASTKVVLPPDKRSPRPRSSSAIASAVGLARSGLWAKTARRAPSADGYFGRRPPAGRML